MLWRVCVVLAVLCGGSAVSWAQIKPIALDGVPRKVRYVAATADGGLLLVPDRRSRKTGQPMTRILASKDAFQLDRVVFSEPGWADLMLEYASEANAQTTWAVGEGAVIYRQLGQSWGKIEIGKPNRRACSRWSRFGTVCQMLAPLSAKRAVVMRPTYAKEGSREVLGTQVVPVEIGRDKPLGSLALPGVALGPMVPDGLGGFWVMVRRTKKSSNYKPMRGYLHYTSAGQWWMWSDSGEQVEGTELKGRAKFLIEPEPRKMATDGKGGFFAVGQDQVIYRVDADGVAREFSRQQPRCLYCKQVAIAFDERKRELHVLTAQWKEGEAGKRTIEESLSWMRFDEQGSALAREPVPMPERFKRYELQTLRDVSLHAAAGNAWLHTPRMLLFRDDQGWSWVTTQAEAAKQQEANRKIERRERANPTLAQGALYGGMGLAAAGFVGSFLVAPGEAEDLYAILYGGGAAGFLAYYPALWFLPNTVDRGDPGELRGVFAGFGALGMVAGAGGGMWLVGSLLTQEGDPALLGGALGGAALGTLGSAVMARLVYDNAAEEPQDEVIAGVGAAMAAGLAAFGYMFIGGLLEDREIPDMALRGVRARMR